jgi:hypothetical protein
VKKPYLKREEEINLTTMQILMKPVIHHEICSYSVLLKIKYIGNFYFPAQKNNLLFLEFSKKRW